MHSSRMRTARSSSRLLGDRLPQCMLGYTPQGLGLDTPPELWATPPGLGLDPPGVGLDTPLGVGLDTPIHVGLDPPPQPDPKPPPGSGP